MVKPSELKGERSLSPYLIVLFLNAFVDLGHKITIQNTIFKVHDGATQIVLTALVNALILIPFILLVVPAGRLSDRQPKRWVMQQSAALAVAVALLITLCYYQGWFEWAFFLTLILALQSALFSPAKYGYLREMVEDRDLTRTNGVVQAVTIIAILSGMFLFSLLFEWLYGATSPTAAADTLRVVAPLGWLLVALSIAEWWMATRLPQVPVVAVEATPAQNTTSTWVLIRQNRVIWYSVVGLSLFWGVSQVSIAVFPALAKANLGVTNTLVIQGILASAGLGILVGALVAAKISDHWIEQGLIPLGGVGIALVLSLIPFSEAVSELAVLFLLMGLFGGILIVPLNALIQFYAPHPLLGRILAANNWVQNGVMLTFLLITMGVAVLGQESANHAALLFYLITATALIASILAVKKMVWALARLWVRLLFRRRYEVTAHGVSSIPKQGGVLLLGNHISWIDWAIIQMVLERPVHFVMEQELYDQPLLRSMLDAVGVIPISSQRSKEAIRRVRTHLNRGEGVALFPEGAISHNGQLRPLRRGFEVALAETEAVAVPFYIHGLWGSRFSRSRVRMGGGWKRKVEILFAAPQTAPLSVEQLQSNLQELAVTAWRHEAESQPQLATTWLRRARKMGFRTVLIDAMSGDRLSGFRLLTAVVLISGVVRQRASEAPVGILLPTTAAGVVSNLAVLMAGRRVVNLNYTAPAAAIRHTIEAAGIEVVYTSERFLQRLESQQRPMVEALSGLEVVKLEQVKESFTAQQRISTLLMAVLYPTTVLIRKWVVPVDQEDTAVVIFSSGSEGEPKGVALSHRNLTGNIQQIVAVLEPGRGRDGDRMLGSLPLFHSFGLTATTLMPLVQGIPLVVTPDPTDTLKVVKAIEKYQATLYFGTPTFLQWMTRNQRVAAHQLQTLRLVIAGAERLKESVRVQFEEKFGHRVYEGYGATETSPVSCVNVFDRVDEAGRILQQGNQPGTVGHPLPGTRIKIVEPQTMQPLANGEAGLVLVRGVQVMRGYLQSGVEMVQPFVELEGGGRWYKSGDKGSIDANGFLTIVDRYSRFAKIGGEMVSLTAVEIKIRTFLREENEHCEVAVIAVEDERKGEQLLLFVQGSETIDLRKRLRQVLDQPLWVPAQVVPVKEIPLLGSGKRDYGLMKRNAVAAWNRR